MPLSDLEKLKSGLRDGSVHPMEAKKSLGREIVGRYHGLSAAISAEENFVGRFRDNRIPDEMDHVSLSTEGGKSLLCKILAETGLVKSNSEGRRAIQQGGVKVNGDKVSDENLELNCGMQYILQVGKRRFVKVSLD